jgi:S1-C subfamily serine protease
MGLNKFALFICLGGLSMIPPILTAFVKTVALDTGIGWKFAQLKQALSQPKLEHLRHQAQSITVKVLSQDYLGSGILIKKQGTVYTVLTNAHVLRADDPPYRVQTPDGRIYPANLLKSLSFSKTDLALLQFRNATSIYTVASLASSKFFVHSW